MATQILFTIPNFTTAGSGRAMLNVIERLDRKRYAPSICVSALGGDLCREIERQGIPLLEAPFTVPALPFATLPFRAWRHARFFRPYGFTMWHSFHYIDDYTEPLIARMAGARAWVYTKKNMSWNRRWYLRSLCAAGIAAQNTAMLRKFFPSLPFREKARLIPPGVDQKTYRPQEQRRLGLREQLGISADTIVAASVGHLVPVKGHGTLIRAAAALPNLHVWIAGRPLDAEYAASLEQLRKDLHVEDRVQLLGNIKDIPAFLAEADIFVLPTVAKWRMEGCPVALLEAMACGLPAIATNIPGAQDVIQPRSNGLLVPPEDHPALADALGELASSADLRRALGNAGRDRVLNGYTTEREADQYDRLYRTVLQQA